MKVSCLLKHPVRAAIIIAIYYRKLNWMSDEKYIKLMWKAKMDYPLNLENPRTFNEKLQWIKLNYHDDLMTTCVDKYTVRDYVEQCGLGKILNELYAVYDRPEEIDFSKLPDTCFLKCTNGCDGNFLFDRGNGVNTKLFNKRFNRILNDNLYYYGREWPYKNVQPKIIVEKVLRDKNGKLPIDYKFFCFNGKAEFVFINKDVCDENGVHRKDDIWDVFDLELNPLDFTIGDCFDNSDDYFRVNKPENWEKMIEYAEILSKPFPHARIDFYNIDGKIIFGEITFFHCSGFSEIKPIEWDYKLGELINLNNL